jgi:transposase-like protein
MEVTLTSLTKQIPNDEAAYTWLESIRWPNGPVCPRCVTVGHAYHLKPKNGGRKTRTGTISQRKLWKCGSCRKQFSVTVGTVMERSKIPVRNWVMAFHLFSSGKNGLSSHELGPLLEVSHESA